MRRQLWVPILLAGPVIAGAWVAWPGISVGQRPDSDQLPAPRLLAGYRGAASCAAAACHGGTGRAGTPGCEYSTWIDRDRHARAYQVLLNDRSRIIVAGIQIVYSESLRARAQRLEPDPAIEQWLATWSKRLDLGTESSRPGRQRRLIEALAKLSGEKLTADPTTLNALDRLADHGFEEVRKSAVKENPALVKSLDRLLEAVRSRAGVRLRDVLSSQDPGLLHDFQSLGDSQWEARRKKMQQYDPRELKKDLKKLHDLLPR